MDRFAGLLEYYEQLQSLSETPVARHSVIKMDELGELLPWCVLAEWTPPETLTVILTGTAIEKLLGINLDQENMFDLYDKKVRDIYSKYYSNITGIGCGGYSQRLIQNTSGDVYLVNAAYLPLKNREGVPNIILGAMDVVLESPAKSASSINFLPDFSSILELSYFDIGAGTPEGEPMYGADSIPTSADGTDWAKILKFK